MSWLWFGSFAIEKLSHATAVIRDIGCLTESVVLEDIALYEQWPSEVEFCCEVRFYFQVGLQLTMQASQT